MKSIIFLSLSIVFCVGMAPDIESAVFLDIFCSFMLFIWIKKCLDIGYIIQYNIVVRAQFMKSI